MALPPLKTLHLFPMSNKCSLLPLVLAAAFVFLPVKAQRGLSDDNLPREILSGPFPTGHVQGIAVDRNKGFVYYAYTTLLVKSDLQGHVIGTVKGLQGHLGCLEWNEQDSRVYGSLEYKDDAIGKGILNSLKSQKQFSNGFYVAIFDGDKIDRMDMDAERDGVMTAVYLPTVLKDYSQSVQTLEGVREHRLGCSGIDGITFGPSLDGKKDGMLLTVSYGIYADKERSDNDYQVLLQYDTRKWSRYEQPLSQDSMHKKGPKSPAGIYYAFTGNTTYGVQNLEYDAALNLWFMAVYKGVKPQFPNYSLFAVDGSIPSKAQKLAGVPYISKGQVLTLSSMGLSKDGITGWNFPYGSTGLHALGGGLFYVSEDYTTDGGQGTLLRLYRFTGDASDAFEKVE